ncbi:MAG: tetratricopeptide repeat protein [Betaproteobacteria bacterium]
MNDGFGLGLSCESAAAAQAYQRAVDAYLHAWPGVGPAVDEALAEAPDFALAHALRALHEAVYMRRAEVAPAIDAAQRYAAAASERERSHVAVLANLLQGNAAQALEGALAHVAIWPTDALVASLPCGAFGLFAFSGRLDHNQARLAYLRRLRPHFPADHPWLLTNLGWACIEAGELDEGFEHAQRSFALRPANGNIAHVLMHGHFERGDAAAGLAFIDAWLPSCPEDAMLFGHLHWHAGLCETALGRADAALARHLRQVLRQLDTAPPLVGLTDAIALTWRLHLLGHSELPWDQAAAYAQRHFGKGGNVFAEFHLAILATARGDRAGVDNVNQRLQAAADKGDAAAPIALHWAAALVAMVHGDRRAAGEKMRLCNAEATRLGGSHAQRTVIDRTIEWLEAA